jgi:hypothetical protein
MTFDTPMMRPRFTPASGFIVGLIWYGVLCCPLWFGIVGDQPRRNEPLFVVADLCLPTRP